MSIENASTDLAWMQLALEEAQEAAAIDEAPVGAVVVQGERLISRAHDRRQSLGDPTAHAEILALSAAGKALGDWRLDGCDLYVTLEPCPMCAGAIVMARIRRLIYGAPSRKAGAIETHCRLLDIDTFNHKVEVTSGILANESAALLSQFFKRIRTQIEG